MVILLHLRVDFGDGVLHSLMVNVAVIRLGLDGLGSRGLGGGEVVWTPIQLFVVFVHFAVFVTPLLVLAFAGIFDPFPLVLESALIVRVLWSFVRIGYYLGRGRGWHSCLRSLRFCGCGSQVVLIHRVRLGFILVDELCERPRSLASDS